MTEPRDPRWRHLAELTAFAHDQRAGLLHAGDAAVIPHLDDAGANWRDLLDDLDLAIANDADLYPFVAGLDALYALGMELAETAFDPPATAVVKRFLRRLLATAATGLTDHLPK